LRLALVNAKLRACGLKVQGSLLADKHPY